jgi:hypothetical protein
MSGVITMTKFGRMGRFGNQIFQLMFLADYARVHNLELQLPPWVGDQLFKRHFSPMTVRGLQTAVEHDETFGRGVGIFPTERAKGISRSNFDYHGYGQYHTSYYAPNRAYLTSLFDLQPEVTERLSEPVTKLRNMGKTIVGVHLRRGDYGRGMFYITPVAWYLDLLETLWPTLDEPVLFISTETPALVPEFAKFNPQTSESLGIDLRAKPLTGYNYLRHDLRSADPRQLDWVPDWVLLRHCNMLLIPNSTFSFSAALFPLCEKRRQCFKSCLVRCGSFMFEPFSAWNAQPMTYAKAEAYPDLVDQNTVKSNPYWKD